MICENGVIVSNKTVEQLTRLITSESCAPWYLKSTPILKRCIPQTIPVDFNITITNKILSQAKAVIEQLAKVEGIVDKAISTRFVC